MPTIAEVTVPEVTVPVAPRLALGVELLGEFKNSGYNPPPFLVRRPDGQVIQMSRLLYLVAALIDGIRSSAAIAELASADLGRSLGADQVRYIITAKLLPLGLIAGPAPRPPRPPPARCWPCGPAARCYPNRPPTSSRRCCGRCSAGPPCWRSSPAPPPWTGGSSRPTSSPPGLTSC